VLLAVQSDEEVEMSASLLVIVVAAGLLGLLSGWLLPILFKSRRPFGLGGDLIVSTVAAVALAYVEWVWILPALGFEPGWLSIAAAIGDPVGLAWVCLWLMRKIRQ
jgi:hypothetical protein